MKGCHFSWKVEEYRGIWGGGTQWKDVTWLVGVHLGGHGFWIQEYMSSKERMGVMRYSEWWILEYKLPKGRWRFGF